MKKVVFITGSSSGIGLETAKKFHQMGWQVIATMRNPEKRETELHSMQEIKLLHVDVCDEVSMRAAIDATIKEYGQIDVLVNNAGYDLLGAVENMTRAQIARQIDTNVVGLIQMTSLVLPHMRKRRSGTIINISSVGGRITFPIYSIYHATKWAVEGFSESILYELKPYGINVRVIEPGPINTNFYSSSFEAVKPSEPTEYDDYVNSVVKESSEFGKKGAPASVVAKTIYKAAISRSKRLRYPIGGNAAGFLFLHKLLPRRIFMASVEKMMVKK